MRHRASRVSTFILGTVYRHNRSAKPSRKRDGVRSRFQGMLHPSSVVKGDKGIAGLGWNAASSEA